MSDYVLTLTLLPVTCVYEYTARILFADIGEANKFFLILFAPIGLVYCLCCLCIKIAYMPYTVLIVKSRISDGRLRVSYGYRRDNIENQSLSHFEDARMSKFLEVFQNRTYANSDASISSAGSESYRNITGGADNDDYRSSAKVEYEYEESAEDNDDVSKVTFSSSIAGPDNSIVNRIKTKFKSREPNYTGRKVRVVPTSPFLQLSRVHQVEEVQGAIPRVVPPPLYKKSLVPLPLAVQQQMMLQKAANASLANKPDVTNNNNSDQEERAPVLFLDNGTISPYQPGLTSQPLLDHFTSSVDVDYQDGSYVPPVEESGKVRNTGIAMAPTGEYLFGKSLFDFISYLVVLYYNSMWAEC